MSSEWWPVLAVFWGLYLADGLRGGRRPRFHFHHWLARRVPRGGIAHASWFFIPPSPAAWAILAEDLPASLAPEGVTNWPSGSAARPPPLPERVATWRWEDIRKVEDRAGWIHVNGLRFAPASPALSAAALSALARELAPLPAPARAARLQTWHRARLAPARLGRRLRSALVRSRGLAWLNALQTLLLASVSAYLLLDGPKRVPAELGDSLARALPAFLGVLVGLHLIAVSWFFILHRRLHPRAGQERGSLVFTALFVPAQALRLRLHLVAKIAGGLHPLAVALASANPSATRAVAADVVRDLRWPRLAPGLDAVTEGFVRASGGLLAPLIDDMLARQTPPIPAATLLAPPARESAATCAYCPRCGDQFTRADARCPHGAPLVAFADDARKT